MPLTTGGSTSGSRISTRRAARPGICVRANTRASGNPTTKQINVLIAAVIGSVGVLLEDSEVMRLGKSPQLTRASMATRGDHQKS